MVADSDKARELASEQATDWLIHLREEPDNPELLHRFEAWLAESPLNVEAWAVTDHVAGVISHLPPRFANRWRPVLEAYRAGLNFEPLTFSYTTTARVIDLPRGGRSQGVRSSVRLTGGGALAAGLAILLVPDLALHLRADYLTGTAETRSIALSDGSSVTLAPDSAIRVAFGDTERRVELLSGEAFFTVVHDANKPFRVMAKGVETTDLGTAFDVRRGDDGAMIAVQQGRVRVNYRSVQPPVDQILRAGQMMWVAWTGQATRGEQAANEVAAWRRNQLVAEDVPMHEVIDELRPYYEGKIIVTNTALNDRNVTGVYNLSDPMEALRGIAKAHDATVYQITPWLLVVSGE